ncbi:MAG TPA: hypothetical protein VJR87_12440 [Allosphingosinicella sp.]|nr:hypothetical protein [Allosphingosinicella sp.]
MRQCLVVVSLAAFTASPLLAQPNLSAGDRTAAFQAAGFKLKGGQWQACGDPGTATYAPGAIDTVRDLNGDGRPEAVISEGSLFCFGGTEVGYSIVSKQQDGSWKQVTSGAGIPNFLATKGVAGWPDIEVGGPGFCFPVERWNGKAYALHRHEYEGKACRPQK